MGDSGFEVDISGGDHYNIPGHERIARVLNDLRTAAVPWLIGYWQAPDVALQWRLIRVALDIWASPPKIDTPVAVRNLIEERQATTAAILGALLHWPQGPDLLEAALRDQSIDTGLYLSALDICWHAGAGPLYGRLARRLAQTHPTVAGQLCLNDIPPAIAVARLETILVAPAAEDVGPARVMLEKLALQRVREVPLEQRHRVIDLLRALGQGEHQSQTEIRQQCAEFLHGIYGRFLEQALPEVQAADSTGGIGIPALVVGEEFVPVLREFVSRREEKAIRTAGARDEELQSDNRRLLKELDSMRAELARLEGKLEEARVLGHSGRLQETAAAQLPVLQRLMDLSDEIDRAIVGGQGDYATLAWVREQVHDSLAVHHVQAVGAYGERTPFDPTLHQFIGDRGEGHEWYEVLESGYVILLPDQSTVVLKRIPVRPA